VSLKDIALRTEPLRNYWPSISFVVPACNEEENIRAAAESLLKIDYPNIRFVMVNDRSTDRTGALLEELAAQDSRLSTLNVRELPPGWLGKVHALNAGIEASQSEWILLADADIHFSAQALRKAIQYCEDGGIDFLTAMPEVKTRSRMLQVLIAQLFHQGSLLFNPKRLNDPKARTCYGQGAFMLLRRSVYERSERMEWLRMEAVDDTGLALMMRRAGARMGALAGKDEICLEWYPSLRSYIRGVEKNAFALCQYNWGILLSLCLSNWWFFLGFTLAPNLTDSLGLKIFSATSLALYYGAIYFQMKNLMPVKLYQVLLFPVAIAVLPLIFLRAALLAVGRGGIDWRGTFYPLEELKAHQRMKLANLVFSLPE
jgi:glycosyltransferase involved in cell wall biosynthesis